MNIKLMLLLYIFIFSINYLTSSTSANFTSKSDVNMSISAGHWNNNNPSSSLTIVSNGNQNLKSCPPDISIKVKNIGDGPMEQNAFYDVYYVDHGNPKTEKGEKINNEPGIIPKLNSGEETVIKYEISNPGFYKFYVYESEESKEKGIWSEKIKVSCNENGKHSDPSNEKNINQNIDPPNNESDQSNNSEGDKQEKEVDEGENNDSDKETEPSLNDKEWESENNTNTGVDEQ